MAITEEHQQLNFFEKIEHYPPPELFELRDYQKQVIKDLYAQLWDGHKNVLIYAPTGSGKTAIASRIISDARTRERKVLFLVHREPLVDQTFNQLNKLGICAGFIKAGFSENRSLPVQIASIQTLARRDFPENISLIIVDEAHTIAFHQTFERIKEFYPEAIYIGLSASPWRTKKTESLSQYFTAMVMSPLPSELIKMGFLAPARYFGFGGMPDPSQYDTGDDGDYNIRQIQEAYLGEGISDRIVEETSKLIEKRTAILFCSGVEQSKELTKLFNLAGIVTEHLDANTPAEVRSQMYQRLASGETQILSSIGTLTEGFDIPSIRMVIIVRPTKSKSLWHQMIGRGLRIFIGKVDCLILDFGDNLSRLGFPTRQKPFKLNDPKKPSGDAAMKRCPQCNEYTYCFHLICPHCGYEFEINSKFQEDLEFEVQFGELFSTEIWEQFRYLRSQIRTNYKKHLPMHRVWINYKKKFGHYPPNEWHLGAIFGSDRSTAAQQIYRNYLESTIPILDTPIQSWENKISSFMRLEFGVPGKNYQIGSETYTPIKTDFKKIHWWNILGIDPKSSLEEVKIKYRELIRIYHPDTSNYSEAEAEDYTKLLNYAVEQAKLAIAP